MSRMLAILGLVFGGALCAGAQTYTLQIGNISWSGSPGGYNCFSSTAYPNTINFTITHNQSGAATYAVTAGISTSSGSYNRQLASGGYRLNYQLYTTSAITYVLQAPMTATPNNVISGSNSTKNTVIPLSFTFFVPPGQAVPPGTYTDTVTIGIYSAYNSLSPMTTQTITISVVVAAAAAVSIVPTGGPFNSANPQLTLNFGTLSVGQIQSCDVLIKQNNNCTVFYSSANNGVLKEIPIPTTDAIPYTCVAGGLTLDLSHPGSVPLPPGLSPAPDGNRYSVTITIGNLSNPSAGTYQDQITLTVQAQ